MSGSLVFPQSEVRSEPGIYALVMELPAPQRIEVGRLGTFVFPAGHYCYLGSGHGGGGLKARTDRHCRLLGDHKPPRWNIDHLRESVMIDEIWHAYAPSFREHHWSHTVAGMDGAAIVARKFGANDCYPACPTHLYYFESAPLASDFEAALLAQHPDHEPVHVALVNVPALA